MAGAYQHEHVAAVPRGYKVRTVPRGDHEIRLAFPPGRRHRGAGVLVEILHPREENPLCKIVNLVNPSTLELKRATRSRAARFRGARNPSSVYSMAVSLGYPYLRGEGRVAKDGRTWLSRVTKQSDGSGPPIYIGWDSIKRKWIIEKESGAEYERGPRIGRGGNPHMQVSFDPGIKKFLAFMYDEKFGNLYATGFTKKQAAQALREVWRKARKTGSWRNPDLFDAIRPGSRVTFVDKQAALRGEHKLRTGRATMPSGSDGWVLNIGGAHGTPQVVHRDMVVKVSGGRNPDDGELEQAEELYEEFHGREPREILEIQESSEARGEYTALGDLIELTMIAPSGDHVLVKFKNDGVRVASSPNGEQLYLLGGNQDISEVLEMFGADTGKDLLDLGEAKQIVYEAAKWQTNFTPQEWKHDFGEESGVRPRAFFDQLKKRIFFAGGNYKVKRPGIVD